MHANKIKHAHTRNINIYIHAILLFLACGMGGLMLFMANKKKRKGFILFYFVVCMSYNNADEGGGVTKV